MNVNLNTQVIFCRHKAQFLCQPLNFDLNNSTRFGDPDANVRDEKSGLVSISSTFLRTNFSYECHFSSFYYVHATRKSCQNNVRTKNLYIKTLMKLTPKSIFLVIKTNCGPLKKINCAIEFWGNKYFICNLAQR